MIILEIAIAMACVTALFLHIRNNRRKKVIETELKLVEDKFIEFISVFKEDRKTIKGYFDAIQSIKKDLNKINKTSEEEAIKITERFKQFDKTLFEVNKKIRDLNTKK